MKSISILSVVCCLFLGVTFAFASPQDPQKKESEMKAATQESKEDGKDSDAEESFEPIDNMHHFMEYVFEPSYKGLKATLAAEPENRKAWKPFKNHALVLAESTTLLAQRGPEEAEKSKQWKQISLDVHKQATALYKSSGDYDQAKQHYGTMLESCNKCHTVFAAGKYQLEK